MYLVLVKHVNVFGGSHGDFSSLFYTDIQEVARLKKLGAIVYKLDGLEEIKDIEVTYQEIPMEKP